jgi:DNA topoisomerase-1
MKSLVIVESPTKTKTISKYLPGNVVVDASMGHIRDLPSSASEIPDALKKKPWASLGIDVDHDFNPLYVVPGDKKKVVKRLKDLLEDADELILATDEDREGEAISWHLVEVLKPSVPVKRMVFREITREAILKALEETRQIDMNLVHAQETRRILDRLAGYTISPLLWKKISPGLSAGRVQSVAVAFLVERERERLRFRSGSYFDIRADLSTSAAKGRFTADLSHVDGIRVANGKDFDENTGRLKDPGKVTLLTKETADALQKHLESAVWSVSGIDVSIQSRTPAPPFITSTLQQEANRKFGFSAKDTMSIAQKLYEKGFISYMRTDSPVLSNQATEAARTQILDIYGETYLSERVRTYSSKGGAAQEAHEAIRPAGSSFILPEKSGLAGREFKLYDLIWKRTVATQMAESRTEFTTATVEAVASESTATFKATGKRILFPGFFRAYVEGSDDPDAAIEDQDQPLPPMEQGAALDLLSLEALGHETKPPARYTEATLVRELEKRGVGRPSTYATIISTIQDRGYVKAEGKALIPTFTAFAVTELLERYFPDMVDSDFTSGLENRLDDIASGQADPLDYLRRYYLGDEGLRETVSRQEDRIDPLEARRIDLPVEGLEGAEILIGRYGPYIKSKGEDGDVSTTIPESVHPGELTAEKIRSLLSTSASGPVPIGSDPETGQDVFVLSGRYGPYVQLGSADDASKGKPRRASLLKGMKPEEVKIDTALALLSLPRLIGNHPDTGRDIIAGVGRFGPYVVHDGTFKSLERSDDVLSIGYDRALELLSAAKPTRASEAIADLGPHPDSGKPMQVLNGRYGPYLKCGQVNAAIPKGVEPLDLTPEQAAELIRAKGAAGGGAKRKGGRKK